MRSVPPRVCHRATHARTTPLQRGARLLSWCWPPRLYFCWRRRRWVPQGSTWCVAQTCALQRTSPGRRCASRHASSTTRPSNRRAAPFPAGRTRHAKTAPAPTKATTRGSASTATAGATNPARLPRSPPSPRTPTFPVKCPAVTPSTTPAAAAPEHQSRKLRPGSTQKEQTNLCAIEREGRGRSG